MINHPIVTWPDPILSKICEDVETFNSEDLDEFIATLVHTMLQNNGLGLAAPQIGKALNIIAVNKLWFGVGTYEPTVMINPKIEEISEDALFEIKEGCLSVPGYFENRERPARVIVSYYNSEGKQTIEEFRNQNAFVVQHEIDHLNGKVFVDDLSKLKQKRIIKKIIRNKIGK